VLQLLSGDTRKVLDEPYQGCPGAGRVIQEGARRTFGERLR